MRWLLGHWLLGPCLGGQMEDEIKAVKGVSRRLCPPLVSLDRVLLTSTGVLLACWQVCCVLAGMLRAGRYVAC